MASSTRKKVVIVGGGPAGAAAAKAMADRGYQVDLFEAYPNPSLLSNTSSKDLHKTYFIMDIYDHGKLYCYEMKKDLRKKRVVRHELSLVYKLCTKYS